MKKVNLRELYPDVYKNDHFVEVTEDVLETIRAAERAEAAYDRRMYRYKAYYSLDCDNGIENAVQRVMCLIAIHPPVIGIFRTLSGTDCLLHIFCYFYKVIGFINIGI